MQFETTPKSGLGLDPVRSRLQEAAGHWIQARFSKIMSGFQFGKLRVEWPDQSVTVHGVACGQEFLNGYGTEDNPVVVRLENYEPVRALAMKGSMGWAESYMAGNWNTNSLTALFLLFLNNEHFFPAMVNGSRLSKLTNSFVHRGNRNTLTGSRRNIASHYDLGNAFYREWLDESMSYSSACYTSTHDTLASAQQNKMNKVVEAVAPAANDKLLEIGCGWGAMASALNSASGCDVKGISLSKEQLDYARQVDSQRSTAGRIDFEFCDYRHIAGRFDHVVSIEMFEAVGREYWSEYFSKLREVLRKGGTAVLQVITILEDRYERYAAKPDFIQRYIFPGGMLPTKDLFEQYAAEHGFKIQEADFFGDSYARTLRDWSHRFEASLSDIKNQGFDERFVRMWRYYLAYCEAGFETGTTDVGIWQLKRQ